MKVISIHSFISSSGSGTVINYGSGSGSDFLTSYGSGSGSTIQKVTVPTVPVPVPQHCFRVRKPVIVHSPNTAGNFVLIFQSFRSENRFLSTAQTRPGMLC
jgi:hypothetical protein